MEEIRITVIGAGVVGLAIAAELSTRYDNIIVLERHGTFGRETSSRNSEVIHSGIYYPEGSLKARLCVEGSEQLYDVCNKHSIPCKRLGKLIIASDPSELRAIEELYKKGQKNNVRGLAILQKNEIVGIEPNTTGVAALYSPNTGIIDSHSLMKHFYNVAQNNGVLFAFNSEVNSMEREKDGFVIGIEQENYRFKSELVINCAGLSSDRIAELVGIDIRKSGYKLKYCKGSYFSYAKPSPVKILIYPVPHEELAGLGVHATLDLGGRLRFGPDVEYVEDIDYKVDANKKERFYMAALKIIPGLEKEAFIPDMAGVRPKLSGPNERVRDFIIEDEAEKGFRGLINLIGIESPGLTACLGIAQHVQNIIRSILN